MNIFRFILLFALTICIALLACGSAVAIFGLHSNWYSFNQNWLYFIIGFMAFTALVVSFYIFWQKHILSGVTRQFLFFHKLNHEVIHAITAMLTLSGVYSINVSTSGGSVETGGKSPLNFVVALAPYLISFPLLLMLAYLYNVADELGQKFGKHTLHLGSSHPINKLGKGRRGNPTSRKQTQLKGETPRRHLGLPLLHINCK